MGLLAVVGYEKGLCTTYELELFIPRFCQCGMVCGNVCILLCLDRPLKRFQFYFT